MNKICILFLSKTMIYLNRILMNRYLEEELVSILVRPEIYSNVKDNETKNKTHVDTDYE